MGNIVLLDELTINQIAAGEVIERPASVIKEMIENSIDAGANQITVEIKNGGISYIRVTDNGKGIEKDDLEMAFERHATSKIRSAKDLETIHSMGFRGEALASIAAVAKVEMVSKTSQTDTGNRIVVEAGKILQKEETGCPKGTSITVENLFFNTPVRYKFLKKDYTESGYIEDIVAHIALVHPEISFRFVNNGKNIIQTSGNGDMANVIYAIYGKDIASGVLKVEYQYEDIKLTGVVGKPEIARSNRSNQIFFVNSRYVKDKTLSAATEKGYKGLLPIGKYGFVILNVEVDSSKVDVNVHPTKLEVRFEEEGKVFKAVYHAVQDTLLKAELVANTEKPSQREEILPSQEELEEKETNKPNGVTGREKMGFAGLFHRREKIEKQEQDLATEENPIAELYQKKQEGKIQEDTVETNKVEEKEEGKKESSFASTMVMPAIGTNPMKQAIDQTIVLDSKKIEPIAEETLKTPSISDKTIQFNMAQEEASATTVAKEEIQDDEPIFNTEAVTPSEEQVGTMAKIIEMQQKLKEELENRPNAMQMPQDDTQKLEVKEMLDKLDHIDASNQKEMANFEEMYVKTFGKLPASIEEKQKEEEQKFSAYELIKDNNISVFETDETYSAKPPYHFIGIAFRTYIILEIDKELYILDQHAAHERIMYEKVKKNYYSDQKKDSQLLLLPDIITLTHKEMDIAKENIAMFERAGFMLEEFGENTIKLTGAPDICVDLDTKELFLETLDEINTVARTAKQEKEERFIATVACKAAVKAHMALDKKEVESLLDELLVLPNPFTCPHGRPTAIKMTQNDIERKFARRK